MGKLPLAAVLPESVPAGASRMATANRPGLGPGHEGWTFGRDLAESIHAQRDKSRENAALEGSHAPSGERRNGGHELSDLTHVLLGQDDVGPARANGMNMTDSDLLERDPGGIDRHAGDDAGREAGAWPQEGEYGCAGEAVAAATVGLSDPILAATMPSFDPDAVATAIHSGLPVPEIMTVPGAATALPSANSTQQPVASDGTDAGSGSPSSAIVDPAATPVQPATATALAAGSMLSMASLADATGSAGAAADADISAGVSAAGPGNRPSPVQAAGVHGFVAAPAAAIGLAPTTGAADQPPPMEWGELKPGDEAGSVPTDRLIRRPTERAATTAPPTHAAVPQASIRDLHPFAKEPVGSDAIDGEAHGSGDLRTLSLRFAHAGQAGRHLTVPVNTLAFHIAHKLDRGINRFEIRLDPPELGRVDVRLEVDADARVRVHLTVERPEALDLLQRDARALERALSNAGLETDGKAVTFSLETGTRGHGDESGAGSDGSSAGKGSVPTATDDDAGAPAAVQYISSTGVDIRV